MPQVDHEGPRRAANGHAEWITLQDNPDFRDLVDFLRAELDRIGSRTHHWDKMGMRQALEALRSEVGEAMAINLDP
jgi:hypothetical protein